MKKYFAQLTSSEGGEWFEARAQTKKEFLESAKRYAEEKNFNLTFAGEGAAPKEDKEFSIKEI